MLAASGAFAFSSPLFSSGDEAAHVDYAYQVWTGSLPEFHAGLVIQPGFGFVPPVQWVSQHPPLYYVIQAPVVGPLIDSGHYVWAGYAARAVNGLLAAALVAAVAWATAQVLPRRPQVWLAAAIVTAANSWVVRVGGSVYNDLLCALWATLLLGLTVRTLYGGATVRRNVLLALTAAAALATRASLIVIVLACLGILVVHSGLGTRSWRRTLGVTGRYTVVGLAALVPSAWFYLRNLRLTGGLLGGDPAWAQQNLHIVPRSTVDVFTDPQSWKALTAVFAYGVWDRDLMTELLLVVPLVLAVVGALATAVTGRRATHGQGAAATTGATGSTGATGTTGTTGTRGARLATLMSFALLAGTTLAIVAMQLQYAAGGSGLNPRYLLPLVLVISLAVGYGLSEIPRVGTLLLTLWVGLTVAEFVRWVARSFEAAPSPGTAPIHPVAAWASVAVCLLALAIALIAHQAVTRVTRRAERRKDSGPATQMAGGPDSSPSPASTAHHNEGTPSS